MTHSPSPSAPRQDTDLRNFDTWVVVIGRNEGERLVRCFDSLKSTPVPVVYVDSASTDNSVAMARARGIEVVELDMSIPFTAARARNAGFARLKQVAPPASWVQFIDGDCEIISGWFDAALAFVSQEPTVGCVCGGVRERFPERSIYNHIADLGAMGSSGEIDACGGIAMMRTDIYDRVGGFRDDLFTGEERELCVRMRKEGFKIWRVSAPMAWHDSAMFHFKQWWRRTRRDGYTFAQATRLFGADDPGLVRKLLSAWLWGALIPLFILGGALFGSALFLLLLVVYPLQVVRMSSSLPGPLGQRLWGSTFMVLGKLPELIGQCQYWLNRDGTSITRSFQKS